MREAAGKACTRSASPHRPPPLCPQVLANRVRAKVQEARSGGRELAAADGFLPSTQRLLNRFLASKTEAPAAGGPANFPPGLRQ